MSPTRYCFAAGLLACAAALAAFSGCANVRPNADEGGSWSFTRPPIQRASHEEADGDESAGLSWSDLSIDNWGKTTKKLTGQGPNRQLAIQYFREADDLFGQAMRADAAQKAHLFALAAPKFAAAAERWPESALAMDGYFYSAESYFFADDYPRGNEQYEKLIKAFPNNRYLDTVDQRRFLIAKYWLDVNRESPEPFYYANWWNKTRPWRDAHGHGLRIYDKIRVDDPTGRLADDATLAAANENFANGKFYKAHDYYSDLRKAYPTSEHQFLAHFLDIKAILNSYQGPAYGGTGLDEAEKLIKQIRRQFPQEAEKERAFLDRAAAEVRFRKAERLMFLGQYHDRRGEYRAAQHYYSQVVRDFTDTPLAQKAEERTGQIAGLPPKPPQQLPWLVALFPESDKVKPLLKATQQIEAEQAAEYASRENRELEDRTAANPGGATPVKIGPFSN